MIYCPRKPRSMRINVFAIFKVLKCIFVTLLVVTICVTLWMIMGALWTKIRDSINLDDLYEEFEVSDEDSAETDKSQGYGLNIHRNYMNMGNKKIVKAIPYGETQNLPANFSAVLEYDNKSKYLLEWTREAENLPTAANILRKSTIKNVNSSKIGRASMNFMSIAQESESKCKSKSGDSSEEKITTLLHSVAFNIEEVGLCNTNNIDMLILVYSKADHFGRRQLIRQTYGSLMAVQGRQIRLLFSLGLSRSATIQSIIESESRLYRDLIQGNFQEHWHNLTLKFNLALRWVGSHCPQAKYFVKVDDDTFLDSVHLSEFLHYMPSTNFIYCQVAKNRSPIRLPSVTKWYVPRSVYRKSRFPHYCLGLGFVLSGDILPQLLGCSLAAKVVLPLDDVFYTGILTKLLGLSPAENLWKGHGFDWLVRRHIASQAEMADYIFFASKNNSVLSELWQKLWRFILVTLSTTPMDE